MEMYFGVNLSKRELSSARPLVFKCCFASIAKVAVLVAAAAVLTVISRLILK